MDQLNRISRILLNETTDFLAHHFPFINSVEQVIQLGTGMNADVLLDEEWGRVPLADLPQMPEMASLAGQNLQLVWGLSGTIRTLILSGRFHLYEGHGLIPCILPILAAVTSGARTVLLCNAAGGIRPDLSPGSLMLIADHINQLGVSPLIGHRHLLKESFVDLTDLYAPELRTTLLAAARAEGIPLTEGIYLATPGPQFETPAEVRMFRSWGADAVGMSTVLEALTARSMGARVAGISLITNRAAGLGTEPISHQINSKKTASEPLLRLIRAWTAGAGTS